MHRSSETIGAIAAALAKAQGELTNPEKSLIATVRSPFPQRSRSELPLRLARQRSRYRPQKPRPARDRHGADHRDRPGFRPNPADHAAGPCVGRMDFLGLAGLPDRRGAAANGSGADLRPALRPVCPGRHCRRGRPRCARPLWAVDPGRLATQPRKSRNPAGTVRSISRQTGPRRGAIRGAA